MNNTWLNDTDTAKKLIRMRAQNLADNGDKITVKICSSVDVDGNKATGLALYVNGCLIDTTFDGRKCRAIFNLWELRKMLDMLESFRRATA